MTVEEPWAGVVGLEADGDIVARGGGASADDVAPDGVVVVVFCAAGAAHNSEDVLKRGVRGDGVRAIEGLLTPCKWKGWGAPGALAVAGKDSSMVAFDGRVYTLPEGRRS